MSDSEKLDLILAYVKDIREQLTGSPELGKFPGWVQLGGKTVVDALAAAAGGR